MFSHVSHSLVSALVQDSAQENNQNVAPFHNDIPGRSLFKHIRSRCGEWKSGDTIILNRTGTHDLSFLPSCYHGIISSESASE